MKNLRMKLLLPVLLIGIAWLQEIIDQLFFNSSFNLPVSPGEAYLGHYYCTF